MNATGWVSLVCAAALTIACGGNATRDDDAATIDRDGTIGTTGESEATEVTSGDREFVEELTYAGAAEIELGKLASERAQHADVKRFGQMMVEDHTKAGNELKQIAAQYNIAMPSGLDEKHRDLQTRLSGLRGREFDKAYIEAMVDGHQDVVDKLQSRVDERDRSATLTGQAPKDVNVKPEDADHGAEASLNGWSATALPVVKAHLERAQSLEKMLDRDVRDTSRR